jgi:hypothetical protein
VISTFKACQGLTAKNSLHPHIDRDIEYGPAVFPQGYPQWSIMTPSRNQRWMMRDHQFQPPLIATKRSREACKMMPRSSLPARIPSGAPFFLALYFMLDGVDEPKAGSL